MNQVISIGGRVVGVIQHGALTKHIEARHYLRDPRAIAFAQEAIDAAQRAGVSQIIVTDTDTGTIYSTSWADFMAFSWTFSRGFGPQRAMRLNRWTVNGQPPSDGKPTQPTAPQPAQLSLW